MPQALKPGVWFVRSNGGGGSYPVTPEGWRVVLIFSGAVAVSGILGIALSQAGFALWWAVFAIGMVASATWFILKARRHTDLSMTVAEFQKLNSGSELQNRG